MNTQNQSAQNNDILANLKLNPQDEELLATLMEFLINPSKTRQKLIELKNNIKDPEKIQLIDSLLDIPEQYLSVVKPQDQDKLNKLIKLLQKIGYSEQDILNTILYLHQLAIDKATETIIKDMTKKELEKFKAFLETGPNRLQVLLLLQKYLELEKKPDLAIIIQDAFAESINDLIEELSNAVEKERYLQNLPDEDKEQFIQLTNQGKYIEALKVIYK